MRWNILFSFMWLRGALLVGCICGLMYLAYLMTHRPYALGHDYPAVVATFHIDGTFKSSTCIADGKTWPGRSDGSCHMSDKPK